MFHSLKTFGIKFAVVYLLKEGDVVFTHETTYQGDYNTKKFLQENPQPIAMHAAGEPYQVEQHEAELPTKQRLLSLHKKQII